MPKMRVQGGRSGETAALFLSLPSIEADCARLRPTRRSRGNKDPIFRLNSQKEWVLAQERRCLRQNEHGQASQRDNRDITEAST